MEATVAIGHSYDSGFFANQTWQYTSAVHAEPRFLNA